jgi:hypothetical protein
MLKNPDIFSIDLVLSAIEAVFSAPAALFSPAVSPFACARKREAQHKVASAISPAARIIIPERFNISAASKSTIRKLAEVFYLKSATSAQNPHESSR